MTRGARTIVIDAERCVGCGDCSIICPAKVYVTWKELTSDKQERIRKLSLDERHIRFADPQSNRAAKKAEQLADKVFAYVDVESCVACRQCSDACWKEAVTIIAE